MGVDVSVVIVTFNSLGHIQRCLESIYAQTRGVSFEVIVVDNASRDGSAELVEATYPSARLLRRRRNGGLSAAVNDGVRISAGRFVMAINPDTLIDGDVFTVLSSYLGRHGDVGIVAPRLLDDDGTLQLSCRAFPGYATALFNRYSIVTRLFPRNNRSRRYLMADFDHASTRDVDWVSGAALMFARAVFDEVGGWDAGFFMFSEDVDFCRRVHDAGYRVVYEPAATVYHAIGVSKHSNARMIVARHRSMWRYYRKHLRSNVVTDIATAAGIATRCALMLLQRGAANVVGRRP